MTEGQHRILSGLKRENRYIGLVGIMGTWATWFLWSGAVKSLAVLLPTLRDQMATYTWVIGWMIVIMDVSIDLMGPIASPVGKFFGIRTCVMTTGLTFCLAFIIASFSSSPIGMAVVLAVLAGPPLGISNILCRELIGRCFSSKNITTAFSISHTGSPVAYMVMPALSQLFLDTYGWRGAMLLLGAIFFHFTVCGALFRWSSNNGAAVEREVTEYSLLASNSGEEEHQRGEDASCDGRDQENRLCSSALRSFCQNLNTELFYDVSYWLIAIIVILIQFGNLAWFVYFVPHTRTKGFTPADAVIFTAIVGLMRGLTGLIIGPMLDKIQIISTKGLLGISLVPLTAYYFIDPWMTSYWLNVVNLVIYGCSVCLSWLLTDVLLCEEIGVDRVGSAFGWIAMKSGIVRFMLLYLPGLLFDLGGTYTLAFMLLGCTQVFTIAALLLLVWIKRQT